MDIFSPVSPLLPSRSILQRREGGREGGDLGKPPLSPGIPVALYDETDQYKENISTTRIEL